MEKKILTIAIKNWNERFAGISALDIADKLKISNAEAMLAMEELCSKQKGTINANVILYEVKFKFDKKTKLAKVLEPVPVETHIFFPAKSELQNYYKRNLQKFYKNGEYKNRLRQGYSQIALLYFDLKVLTKYLDNKEMYDLNDDVTGGVIHINHEVVSKMTQDEYDEIGFDKVWYGKRSLQNGNTVVSAILIDLSKLPIKEQSYWHGFEVDNPSFVEYDPDFAKFVQRAYDGEWVESEDPIQNIYEGIQNINKLLQLPIFKHTSNPYLKYPTNNTFKDFADANSELYKIIGPDNLNTANLREIYKAFFNNAVSLLHDESNRPLSALQLLQKIIDKISAQTGKRFKSHWVKIKENRIEGDHKITTPKSRSENFISIFRSLCEETVNIFLQLQIDIQKKGSA